MKFNAKEIILFAAIFALVFAIYMVGEVLKDFDTELVRLKAAIMQCEMSGEN